MVAIMPSPKHLLSCTIYKAMFTSDFVKPVLMGSVENLKLDYMIYVWVFWNFLGGMCCCFLYCCVVPCHLSPRNVDSLILWKRIGHIQMIGWCILLKMVGRSWCDAKIRLLCCIFTPFPFLLSILACVMPKYIVTDIVTKENM